MCVTTLIPECPASLLSGYGLLWLAVYLSFPWNGDTERCCKWNDTFISSCFGFWYNRMQEGKKKLQNNLIAIIVLWSTKKIIVRPYIVLKSIDNWFCNIYFCSGLVKAEISKNLPLLEGRKRPWNGELVAALSCRCGSAVQPGLHLSLLLLFLVLLF